MMMKKITLLIVGILFSLTLQAQTDGISYQAVILNPDSQQIPGEDAPGTVLVETLVSLRFTIQNEGGITVYQEILETMTDQYGMVNVFIGTGEAGTATQFNQIDWDGTRKSLFVELDINNRGFQFISQQELTFIPEAYHRNIYAAGDLVVEGNSQLNGDVTIEGQTTLNNGLELIGDLNIDGDLGVSEDIIVGEDIVIGDDLTVDGVTNLNDELSVNNGASSTLTGTLEVNGATNLDGTLAVGRSAFVAENLIIQGNHSVSGSQDIGGNQQIDGDTNMDGDLSVGQMLNVASTADIASALTVGGETNLLARLNVASVTTIGGTLTVDGVTIINDNFEVSQNGIFGGTLNVGGKTTLSQNLDVAGATTLNGILKVDGGTNALFTGEITVEGLGRFNNGLDVSNASPAMLSGTLNVVKDASFDDDVVIDGTLTVLNNFSGSDLTIAGNSTSIVALFENTSTLDGADGIAVKLNDAVLDANNKFISFRDADDNEVGSIEGLTAPADFGQTTGVVYGSTGADYAEWLEKEHREDNFKIGEVVGVKGGKISRNTNNADHVLTISLAPIVLGNKPAESKKGDYEKVGFMGQVPALVVGKVEKGDYIVASGNHDGYAKAIAPEKITLSDLNGVIGKAWSASSSNGISTINVSVGLKSNEWVTILEQQNTRIKELETKLETVESLSQRLKMLERKVDATDMN